MRATNFLLLVKEYPVPKDKQGDNNGQRNGKHAINPLTDFIFEGNFRCFQVLVLKRLHVVVNSHKEAKVEETGNLGFKIFAWIFGCPVTASPILIRECAFELGYFAANFSLHQRHKSVKFNNVFLFVPNRFSFD